MSWQTIKRLNEERGEFLGRMKAILKKSEDEKRDLTEGENKEFDDLNTKAELRKTQIEQYERAAAIEAELAKKGETRVGREDIATPEQGEEKKKKETRQAFDSYLRHGTSGLTPDETRALTVTGAGIVGDRPFYDQLVLGLKWYAGVRQCGATILPTADGNPLTVPSMNDTSNVGVLVGEDVSNTTEVDPSTGTITLSPYKFDSQWIQISIELLQDAAYPVEATVLSMASERIGRALNRYTTTGTGSGQPNGFVTAAGVGYTAALTNAFTYEELLSAFFSVDAAYRNTGKCYWMMHDTTLAAIRKLKNPLGQYIFSAGEGDSPTRILNAPYVVNNDMPQLTSGAGSSVMAFGDFSRYFVRDVTAPYVVRADELFIAQGLVGFRVFSRHDGNLADLNAVKLLNLAAS